MGRNDAVLASAGIAAAAGILGFVLQKRFLNGDKYDGLDSAISYSSRKIAGGFKKLGLSLFQNFDCYREFLSEASCIFSSRYNCLCC
jgi:hypothetical protein